MQGVKRGLLLLVVVVVLDTLSQSLVLVQLLLAILAVVLDASLSKEINYTSCCALALVLMSVGLDLS